MARVWWKDEIEAQMSAAERLLASAKELLRSAEAVTSRMMADGHDPADVDDAGELRYKEAGQLIYQAIQELTAIGATEADGLPYPVVAKTGSPLTWNRLYLDVNDVGGVNLGHIEATSTIFTAAGARELPDPFDGRFSAGQRVKIIRCSNGDLNDFIGTIESLVAAAGPSTKAKMRFEEDFPNFTESDQAEEQTSIELRLLDDGT